MPTPESRRGFPPRSVRGFGLSDVGRKRKVNEDAFFVDDEIGLYVVADGMGGHAAGEVASQEAVETIWGMVKRGHAAGTVKPLVGEVTEAEVRAACRLVESAIQAATYMVFSMAELDRDKSGMGTTISLMLAAGDYAILGQVGDSRVYRISGDRAEQLTEDHTLVNWQIKHGLIAPQDAEASPHKNVITRAVGNRDYVEADTHVIPIFAGQRFLLCSDGLHGYLQEEEIAPIVHKKGLSALRDFIALANDRGGRDNITAVLVELD